MTASASATGPVLPMAPKNPIISRATRRATAKAIKRETKKATEKVKATAAETVSASTGKEELLSVQIRLINHQPFFMS